MPKLQDKTRFPVQEVFSSLRDKWLAQDQTRTNVSLTAFLSEKTGLPFTPQQVSQWSTGTGTKRIAPSAVYALMRELGYSFIVHGNGTASLVRSAS